MGGRESQDFSSTFDGSAFRMRRTVCLILPIALENGGKHIQAFFGEGLWNGSTLRRHFCGRKFRPQIIQFFWEKLKHIVLRKLVGIVSNRLVHALCLDAIEFRHIRVDDDRQLPNEDYSAFDIHQWKGGHHRFRGTILCFLLCIHVSGMAWFRVAEISVGWKRGMVPRVAERIAERGRRRQRRNDLTTWAGRPSPRR